jgi:hypothetical protein
MEKWLREIDDLVSTDFCADMMKIHAFDDLKFSQKDADKMADIIGSVYMYAHRIHCDACAGDDGQPSS